MSPPLRLTQLPRLRTPLQLRKMMAEEGGCCKVALRLGGEDARSLRGLRLAVGNKVDYGMGANIGVFDRLPASGLEYYEETPRHITSHKSAFGFSILPPYKSSRKNGVYNVACDFVLPESSNPLVDLTEGFKDIQQISYARSGIMQRYLVARKLSEEEADRILERASKAYKQNTSFSVKTIVLALQVEPLLTPESSWLQLKAKLEWKLFPFCDGN
jgi:hypothetical protein